MSFDTLINLHFRKTEGSIDLTKSKWSSVVVKDNVKYESIDYSAAGKFDGECAYFDGNYSMLKRLNGKQITLNDNADFTFSFWVNYNSKEFNIKQFILSGMGSDTSDSNSIYLFYDANTSSLSVNVVDNSGTHLSLTDLNKSFADNDWNHVCVIRKSGTTSAYINGKSCYTKDSQTSLKSFNFSNIQTIVGMGYDEDHLYESIFNGYLDDVVLIPIAIDTNTDGTLTVPNSYLINLLKAESFVESSDNLYVEKEKEFSRYDDIVDVIEWKRFNTKTAINLRQNGLVPYRLTPATQQIYFNVSDWLFPVVYGSYNIGDKVIYNMNDCFVSLVNNNTTYPGENSTDWKIVSLAADYRPIWSAPNPPYNYKSKVVYYDKVFQSAINYNKNIPYPWDHTKIDDIPSDVFDTIMNWDAAITFAKGQYCHYLPNDLYYKSTTDENINLIPIAASNWNEIIQSKVGLAEWKKPNPYMKGDVVVEENIPYYCNIDNNVLEPKSHPVQWTPFLRWVHPTYGNTYHTGDIVWYNGNVYKCIIDKNAESIKPPTEYNSITYYKSNMYKNTADISTSTFEWTKLAPYEVTEEIEHDATEYNNGVPYDYDVYVKVYDRDWVIISTGNIYFKNGDYYVNRNDNSIEIRLWNVMDNHFFTNDTTKLKFETNYLEAYNNDKLEAFLMFINNKFIPWNQISVVRSDRFVTLSVKGLPISYVVTDVKMIKIPFKVTYSESKYIPENGTKIFGFDKDGSLGSDIVISTENTSMRILTYEGTSFDNFYIETNLSNKLTMSNLFVFGKDNGIISEDKYKITAGNLFTLSDPDDEYTVICIWQTYEDPSEDNLSLLPDQQDVRKYISKFNKDSSNDEAPINISYLTSEFDFTHTHQINFDTNIDNSMKYIFNYNKNKYDSVYEGVRPVNIAEYGEEYMNALKRNIQITITEDNVYKLMHSFIVENPYTLVELNKDNKDKYMNKSVIMKIPQSLKVDLTEDNVSNFIGCALQDGTTSAIVILNDSNKDTYIGTTITLKGNSMYAKETLDYDSIIMSRDIYNKNNNINNTNTYAMVFKRGMLPKWYNKIQYTNDVFYFDNIPRAASHLVSFKKTKYQNIVVDCNGTIYTSNTFPDGFTVADGTEINVSLEVDKGFKPGTLNMTNGMINEDTELSVTDAIPLEYTITIIPSEHQTIQATEVKNEFIPTSIVPNTKHTSTFKTTYGTNISAILIADVGYDIGKLNFEKFMVVSDTTIRATEEASLHEYTITLVNNDTVRQAFSATYKDIKYTDKFVGSYGTPYTLSLTSKQIGWDVGKIDDPTNGIISKDVTIIAGVGNVKLVPLYVLATDKQTLTVTYKGITIKEGEHYDVLYGESFTVKNVSDRSYNVGRCTSSANKLTNENIVTDSTKGIQTYTADGTVPDVDKIEISAANVSTMTFAVNIEQVEHQTITVTCNGKEYTSTFQANYGDTISATISHVDDQYNGGSLRSYDKTVYSNITISATPPSIKYFTLNINQSANQTIYVNANGQTYTSSVSLPYGTQWSAWINPAANYNAGSLNKNSGTITGDDTVSASGATMSKRTIELRVVPADSGSAHGDRTVTFTPIGYSVVEVRFTWHMGSDERWELADWIIKGTPYRGTYITNTANSKYWWNMSGRTASGGNVGDRSCYVRVTPGKSYTVKTHSSGYKGRDYGFVLYQNDWVESHGTSIDDR